MNVSEFSQGFDILYNNISNNTAPGLEEFEKSFILTQAQEEILKNHIDPEQGDMAQQIEQLIDGLPEQAKQFLGQMIAQGTPIREAVGQVVEELQTASAATEGNE